MNGEGGNTHQRFKQKIVDVSSQWKTDRDFSLFLIVGIFSGIATGIYNTVFNNFLNDTYQLSAQARGIVEFPRELPGVLIVIVLGFLSFLGEIRIASIGMLAAAVGMLGLGLLSPVFAVMLIWMMLFSLGTHVVMPLTPVIGMDLSRKQYYGARLGRYSAYSLSATIIGYAIVWIGFKYLGFTYQTAFSIGAVSYAFAAFFNRKIHLEKSSVKKIHIIFRKKYLLYYLLSIVNGARKQIFLTFAPWVLIKIYQVDPPVFAILGVVIALVSILTRKIVGNAIDYKGERFILSVEALILIVICIGYSFAADVFPVGVAVVIIAICYILDNSMSAVEMARSTYVRKIAVHPEDVTPTLAAGTSVDHIVAMSIPFLGGLLWASLGYQAVFIAAAAIALINLILSRQMKITADEEMN